MSALVEFRDVGFHYPVAAGPAGRPFRLADLSFTVTAGEVLGVIGPNSAGKTTTIRLLSRVLTPTAGEIRLAGRPLGSLAPWEVSRQVAVVPQELPQAFPFTVEELVLMGRYPHGPARFFESDEDRGIAREAMAATGVLDLAGARLALLSGGERQRAILARALAQRPRLLVLDEPTLHLDLRYQAEVAGLLRRLRRERGLTILLVTHDLNLAADLADRLLLLAEGRLVRLGAAEHVLDEATLSRVYGCPVVVDKHPSSRRLAVHVAWPDAEGG